MSSTIAGRVGGMESRVAQTRAISKLAGLVGMMSIVLRLAAASRTWLFPGGVSMRTKSAVLVLRVISRWFTEVTVKGSGFPFSSVV